MKGRIVWVFWLVVVLAVLTSTASYAWLAMNVSSRVRGIEVEAETDSVYLEISADSDEGYDKNVSFGRVMYTSAADDHELSLVTCGRLPSTGAVRIVTVEVTPRNADVFSNGKYDGTGRYFKAVKSDIVNSNESYIDITSTLKIGDSLFGYYTVSEGFSYTESNTGIYNYYYKDIRPNGIIDYVCIGKVPEGEKLSNRLFWGYAYSDSLEESQVDNTLNIVSLDLPPNEYALKNTVFMRCAAGTTNAKNLRIESVDVEGMRNYLTYAIRVMFVAKFEDGSTKTIFYNHRNPERFDGMLLSSIEGNEMETVTVDIYVYLDGTDESAFKQDGFLTRNDVTVTFTVDDHDYN